jgi:hypothetical protein
MQAKSQGLGFLCVCVDFRASITVFLIMFPFQIGIVDPDCRLIGLHLYDGLFKVSILS